MPPSPPTDAKTKESALAAVTQVIESIAEILSISGISVADACQLLRASAVRVAASELQTESGKASKSRVAAMTGLSRSEVARLWSKGKDKSNVNVQRLSQVQRVIDAWFDSPRYLSRAGDPDQIPIFGQRRSLEHLVKSYGGGIPVRTMLDELLSIDAIEVDERQHVRIKSRVAIQKGLRAASFDSLGVRTSDLIKTLVHNLTSESPHFEGTAFVCGLDAKSIPLVRREIGNRGTTFLGGIDGLLNGLNPKPKHRAGKDPIDSKRVGVGLFYFEEAPSAEGSQLTKAVSRKYLRRTLNLLKDKK